MIIKNVQKLYWKKYAYRVETIPLSTKIIKNTKFLVVEKFTMRARRHGITLNFYFTDRSVAMSFIDRHIMMIKCFYQIPDGIDLEYLKDNPQVRVRDNLFYSKYRWNIIFKKSNAINDTIIDTWIQEYFEENPKSSDEIYFSVGDTRHMYVLNDDLAFIVRLALAEHVDIVERAILRSEFENFFEEPKKAIAS